MLAARNLDQNQSLLSASMNRLSSGSKIAQPADDPAGLAVASKFNAQTLRIQAAQTNVQNAVSYVQTADGYLNGMNSILNRMSQLSVMAGDPTKNSADVQLYQQEFTALQDQLRGTVGGTTAQIGGTADVANPLGSFNGVNLFGPNSGMTVAIGQEAGQTMSIPPTDLTASGGAMNSLISQDSAGAYTLSLATPGALGTVNSAIQQIAGARATVGASESRLNLASTTLSVASENLSAAVSRIQDVDVAQESTQLAKYNVLVQAGTSMLSQANQSASSVLKLLNG